MHCNAAKHHMEQQVPLQELQDAAEEPRRWKYGCAGCTFNKHHQFKFAASERCMARRLPTLLLHSTMCICKFAWSTHSKCVLFSLAGWPCRNEPSHRYRWLAAQQTSHKMIRAERVLQHVCRHAYAASMSART